MRNILETVEQNTLPKLKQRLGLESSKQKQIRTLSTLSKKIKRKSKSRRKVSRKKIKRKSQPRRKTSVRR